MPDASLRLNPSLAAIPMPERIKALPVDPVRGMPVPWFVAWVDDGRGGKRPEFRAADHAKLVRAVGERRCWVCGDRLGKIFTFVVGSMCGLNRTSSEPPSHTECAEYSARACPFLARPNMERREGGLEALGTACPAGEMIRRNPGVTLLWTTRSYRLFGDGRGGTLIQLGDPLKLDWYAEGRPATRAEVAESVRTGLPLLEEMARAQGAKDSGAHALASLRDLARQYEALYPND